MDLWLHLESWWSGIDESLVGFCSAWTRDRPIVPNRYRLIGIGISQEFTNWYRYYERSTNRYQYRLNLLSINRLKLETLKLYEKALLSQYNLK